jgi:hypothetical protein
MMKQTLTLGLIALGLVGCTLPGRGLLGPHPQPPTAATVDVTKAEFGRVPLVTIAAGSTEADYLSALTGAVQAAQARKPDVIFDVVSTVPQTATPLDQITAARALTPQASAVAQTIMGAGVPASRVTLGAMVLAGIVGEQIRVYVR